MNLTNFSSKNKLSINDVRTPLPPEPVLPALVHPVINLPRPPRRRPPYLAIGLVFVATLVALAASFSMGWRQGRQTPAPLAKTAPAHLEIPQGATMIAQCVPGRGTQYILPKDIPQGPIYNVWQGKVIGVEFMFDKTSLLGGQEYIGLPLQSIAYNHINIGLLTTGHAGFEGAHYHMDLFTVSQEETHRITC